MSEPHKDPNDALRASKSATDDEDTWDTTSDSLEDAIARSLADTEEAWERYHTQPEERITAAEYFLMCLRDRGYDVTATAGRPVSAG